MSFSYVIGISILGAILSFACILVLARLAPRYGLVDRPGGRKSHEGDVPLVGGLALFLTLFGYQLFAPQAGMDVDVLMGCVLLLVGVSVVDDLRTLGPNIRLLNQVVVVAMMATLANVQLLDLGTIGTSKIVLGDFALVLTIIGGVGLINALNFCDGMDGLAGGLALIALSFIAILVYLAGDLPTFQFVAYLATCVFVFLLFNARWFGRSKAAVFLGDSGSMLLGFILAWLVISKSQGDFRAFSPVTALWLLTIPLIDTVSIIIRRIIKGRSPFAPDREHFHHIFLLAGYSPKETVAYIHGIALLFAGVGLIGELMHISETIMFVGFLMVFGVYFWSVMHAWKVMKLLKNTSS